MRLSAEFKWELGLDGRFYALYRKLVDQPGAISALSSLLPNPPLMWWKAPVRQGANPVAPVMRSRVSATQPGARTGIAPVSNGTGAMRAMAFGVGAFGAGSPPRTATLTTDQNPTRCQNTTPAMNPPPAHNTRASDRAPSCPSSRSKARRLRIMRPVCGSHPHACKRAAAKKSGPGRSLHKCRAGNGRVLDLSAVPATATSARFRARYRPASWTARAAPPCPLSNTVCARLRSDRRPSAWRPWRSRPGFP